MAETDVALYGGSLVLGPLLLGAVVLFYLWHEHGPITRRGREKMRRRREEDEACLRRRSEESGRLDEDE